MTAASTSPRRGSIRRLFAVYAAVSLIPVILLGVGLTTLARAQANARALAEGRQRAYLIASVAVAPLLNGSDLRGGLDGDERQALALSLHRAVEGGSLDRLRVRDLDGRVVYASDSTPADPGDEHALDAAQGTTEAELTRLNADADVQARAAHNPRDIEIYTPLLAAQSGRRIGVLELYLPYAPIAADVAKNSKGIAIALAAGLALLWLSLLAVSASVTRRLRRQMLLNIHLASHDPLTNLLNRNEFVERLDRRLAAEGSASVAFLDVARFKQVNDSLGHANADRLLIVLAQRLRRLAAPNDLLARVGADKFALLVTDSDPAALADRLEAIRCALHEPTELAGVPLAIDTATGVAVAPADADDGADLLHKAELAMYAAKSQHARVARYQRAHDGFDAAALLLAAQLGAAITANQLVLHYQPKGDLASGTVTEVEALVRWNHPTRGLLFPDSFLPLAEQSEMIDRLTSWVVTTAIHDLDLGRPGAGLSVAVNVSARSIVRRDFGDELLRQLAASGTPPQRLVVEITETSLMIDPAAAARTVAQLAAAGIRVSIDDFGAGQTSLSYLATLPVHELKIDKEFVLAMHDEPRQAAIVSSVIELGHSLGMTVTAEGVETRAALAALLDGGCDTVQGYYLARPAPAAELPAALSRAASALRAVAPLPV